MIRRSGRLVTVLLWGLVLAAVGWNGTVRLGLKAAGYSVYRAYERLSLYWQTRDMAVLAGPHFTVYFDPADPEVARWVLDAAERVYEPVIEQMGYTPPLPVPVVVYPDRVSLQEAFDWSDHQSATGVYWSGVIRVLNPRAWIHAEDDSQAAALFSRLNPLAHEFAHYVLDYQTNGNYPRWFTEGLAQRIEARVTGYRWLEPESSLAGGYYRLSDLESRFDDLENQALAYRVSYLLVDYLAERCGEDGLRALSGRLRWAPTLDSAAQQVCGVPPGDLEPGFRGWVADRMAQLEAELPLY